MILLREVMMWFVKSRRAQSDTDYETWIPNGVVPTLNDFDNKTESRATAVILFEATRVDDVRIHESVSPTIPTYWGTGGSRVPYVYPIQGTIIGRSDTAGPNGKGFAEDGEPMYTIDTVGGHGVATETVVRRLTPTECERLQGFPDNWTDGQADSTRYKQMGNAVAVPVVEWIISRLV
jgi:DNA (cytosine-5)-methyltransferase 1